MMLEIKDAFRSCPICGKKKVEILHHQIFTIFDGSPLSDNYDVVCCDRCGFIYADYELDQSAIEEIYTKYSIYEVNRDNKYTTEPFWEQQRFIETANWIANNFPHKNLRILDIGCANGGLLNQFLKMGFHNIVGIDPSQNCVENTSRLGIQAHVGLLSTLSLNPGKYDCVILSHVLEHVYDLKLALFNVNQILNPDGFIYVEVPDANLYVDYVVSPFQDFNTEHINHFSFQCLSNLFLQYYWTELSRGSKVILSAPEMPYPAIYMIWKKGDEVPHDESWQKDEILRKNIKDYINRSQVIMDDIEKKLGSMLSSIPELIVWGTGQLTMKLLAGQSLKAVNIVAFVDSNPINQGKKIKGIRILSPQEARWMKQPILIASMLHQKSILGEIRDEMKMDNEILTLVPENN